MPQSVPPAVHAVKAEEAGAPRSILARVRLFGRREPGKSKRPGRGVVGLEAPLVAATGSRERVRCPETWACGHGPALDRLKGLQMRRPRTLASAGYLGSGNAVAAAASPPRADGYRCVTGISDVTSRRRGRAIVPGPRTALAALRGLKPSLAEARHAFEPEPKSPA